MVLKIPQVAKILDNTLKKYTKITKLFKKLHKYTRNDFTIKKPLYILPLKSKHYHWGNSQCNLYPQHYQKLSD